jgi:hypothetical protein
MMRFEATSMSWSVEIDRDLFAKNLLNDNCKLYYDLEEIEGVSDVDYDGHFGAFVFFELDLEVNVPETLNKVKKIIEEHLKK